MELPEKTQQQLFDEKVYSLHEQGLKYPEIAKMISAPYVIVKAIGERRYRYGTIISHLKRHSKAARSLKTGT